MKTKKELIEELREFHNNLQANGILDRSDLQAIIILVYSPKDLGNDDDMWHLVTAYYNDRTPAMDRYLTTSATSARVIIWTDGMSWNGLVGNTAIEIDNMIEEINQCD